MNETQIESLQIVPCGLPKHKRFKDVTGQKFDRLLAESFYGCGPSTVPGRKRYYYRCKCECGNISITDVNCLRKRNAKSCGCLKRESSSKRFTTHGMTDSSEYQSWANMIQRCTNPNNNNWKHYGARGIAVCPGWSDFKIFISDMGKKPDGYEIERVDNSKGYSPSNCRWASMTEQARNTRHNHNVTINGVTKCLSAWAESLKISMATVKTRLRYGWDDVDALITPPARKDRVITLDGVTHSISEWTEIMGFPYMAIWGRLAIGWTERDAVMTPVKRRKTKCNPTHNSYLTNPDGVTSA